MTPSADVARALERIETETFVTSGAEWDWFREDIATLRAALAAQDETWRAHVPVTGTQHDPSRGLIHGYCERCRMPWPCEYAPEGRDVLRRERDALREALTPFASGGAWGTWKAWMVEATRMEGRVDIGLDAAQRLTGWQCQADAVLAAAPEETR